MEPMRSFLTQENIDLHKQYQRELRLRYSILEKSVPAIQKKSPAEIHKMNLKKGLREEVLPLLQEILSHRTFFDSFTLSHTPDRHLGKFYSSDEAFRYEVLELARLKGQGFIYIFKDGKGRPVIKHSDETPFAYLTDTPVLALDICEHVYFSDYGFHRDDYLRRSIAFLDLARLAP